jgi:hypothetical protein
MAGRPATPASTSLMRLARRNGSQWHPARALSVDGQPDERMAHVRRSPRPHEMWKGYDGIRRGRYPAQPDPAIRARSNNNATAASISALWRDRGSSIRLGSRQNSARSGTFNSPGRSRTPRRVDNGAEARRIDVDRDHRRGRRALRVRRPGLPLRRPRRHQGDRHRHRERYRLSVVPEEQRGARLRLRLHRERRADPLP